MKNIFSNFNTLELQDIILVGVVDIDDTVFDFTLLLDYLYLEIDNKLLGMRRDSITNLLVLYEVEGINCEFKEKIEEHQRFSKVSVGQIIFTDEYFDNRIQLIEAYNPNFDNSQLACSALRFCLHSGQEIFFDPMHYSGINFGGQISREVWIENSSDYVLTQLHNSVDRVE